MNTCDTCKWWDQTSVDGNLTGDCRNLSMFTPRISVMHGHAAYQALVVSDFDDEDIPILNTGPKFGCIHHKAKS